MLGHIRCWVILGVRSLGIRSLGVRSLGVRSLGVQSLGIRYVYQKSVSSTVSQEQIMLSM